MSLWTDIFGGCSRNCDGSSQPGVTSSYNPFGGFVKFTNVTLPLHHILYIERGINGEAIVVLNDSGDPELRTRIKTGDKYDELDFS